MRRVATIILLFGGCGGLTPHTFPPLGSDSDLVGVDTDGVDAVDTDDTTEPVDSDTDVWDTGNPTVDSDSDSDVPVIDTDLPDPAWVPDGTYRGTFKMRLVIPILGDHLCQGQARVVVDSTATPPIRSEVSCSWTLSSVLAFLQGYENVDGLITGYLNPNNSARATGELQVTDHGDFNQQADWTAVFSGDDLQVDYDSTTFLTEGITANFTLTR
jgi:hypothetical protein